jgi:signal transduction histidine kinase
MFGFLKNKICLRRYLEEAEANADRAAFLSEATEVLNSSLDQDEVLQRIARLAVPKICDWCMIDILKPDETLERVVVHRDPQVERQARDLNRRFPPKAGDVGGSAEVIRLGKSQLVRNIPEGAVSEHLKREPEYVNFVNSLGPRSYMSVPMLIRGKALGAINFLTSESGRRFSCADLTLAEELARRAALAVENARLYRLAQDAVAMRDEFLSIASHELKTPITSLKLRLQMAKRSLLINKSPSPEGLARVFDFSSAQVDKLSRLIEDLLDVSRIQAGKLSLISDEFDLGNLVNEVVGRLSADTLAASCTVIVRAAQPVIGTWDRGRLEQVLVNLLSNSIKYAPGCRVFIDITERNNQATIRVQDNGPGVPTEKQAKIFERYERVTEDRNAHGLGLGLFIAKQIVEAHQGKIWVENAPEGGAIFVVQLPLQLQPAANVPILAQA